MVNLMDDSIIAKTLKIKVGDIILSAQAGGICKVTAINDKFADEGFLVRIDTFSKSPDARDLMCRVTADMIEFLELRSLENRVATDASRVPEEIIYILNDWSDSYTIIDEDTYLIN